MSSLSSLLYSNSSLVFGSTSAVVVGNERKEGENSHPDLTALVDSCLDGINSGIDVSVVLR